MADEIASSAVPTSQKRYQYERRRRQEGIASRLKEAFECYGDYTIISHETGIKKGDIQKYVRGETLPSLAIFAVLIETCGLDAAYVLTGEKEEPKQL